MKRSEFDHAIRAAGSILGESEILVFGSQAGYGHVVPQRAGVLDNMLVHDPEVLEHARRILTMAAGSYRSQAIQSVNPIFWLEILFFLPRRLVSATGIEVTSKAADAGLKLVQILYWIVIIITLVLKPELITLIFGNNAP